MAAGRSHSSSGVGLKALILRTHPWWHKGHASTLQVYGCYTYHVRCTATCTGWRCAVATRWSLRLRGPHMSAISATAGGIPSSGGSAKATSPPLARRTRRRPRTPSGASAHGTASTSRGWLHSGARRSSTCGALLAAVCMAHARMPARTHARTHACTHAHAQAGTYTHTDVCMHLQAAARSTSCCCATSSASASGSTTATPRGRQRRASPQHRTSAQWCVPSALPPPLSGTCSSSATLCALPRVL